MGFQPPCPWNRSPEETPASLWGGERRASLSAGVPCASCWEEGSRRLPPERFPSLGPLTHTHAQGPIPASTATLAGLVCLAQPCLHSPPPEMLSLCPGGSGEVDRGHQPQQGWTRRKGEGPLGVTVGRREAASPGAARGTAAPGLPGTWGFAARLLPLQHVRPVLATQDGPGRSLELLQRWVSPNNQHGCSAAANAP